jgi:TldD protein
VAAFDDVVGTALEEARRLGVFVIGRLQDRRDWSLVADNGKLQRVTGSRSVGLGVQLFTASGHSGFASTDLVSAEGARQVVRHAEALARAAARAGAERSSIVHALRREEHLSWWGSARTLHATPRSERQQALLAAHRQALELADGLATRSSIGLVEGEWRIVRSDGTDVRFRLPRGLVQHVFTVRDSDQSATVRCSVSGADDRVLLDEANQVKLQRRARQALRCARDVVGAEPVQPGSYQLVLDHTLAKSLAHEAFGHAAESDVVERSILAERGRLRLGEQVARRGVSIVDGPIADDYAYQPVSANGLLRQTVEIIRDGVLTSGLGDLFSAARAGSPVTGACRSDSYASIPLPRISNIRLVLDQYEPLGMSPDELRPGDVRDRLAALGMLQRGTRTLLLTGTRGGQVSPNQGDFVFGCDAAYDLSDGASARRPATLSGKSLSALRAVAGALGELVLDAPGRCVKGAQGLASCGGSHAYLVLEPHPEVRVGAR